MAALKNRRSKFIKVWRIFLILLGCFVLAFGSGVFLKAGGVLQLAGGDLKMSILAWFVGGIIMVASGFCFAIFATKVSKYNGVIDYIDKDIFNGQFRLKENE